MKVAQITGRCSGHARCAAIAPAIFKLDDNGYSAITEVDIPPVDEMLARRGVRACPERALVILDDNAS
jgi:ferredoxin